MRLGEPLAGAVRVETGGAAPVADYDVLVQPGLLPRLPELLRERCPAHRYAVISDDRVAGLYAAAVLEGIAGDGTRAELFTFAAGEEHKTREVWGRITDEILAAGIGRDAAVVALGGGVVGDLAGFVAATYMRGLPLVQVPTTLLAMIDSSVGGKTGVDTPAGKNLVGAFHPPRVVAADTEVLRTLPPEHLRAGLAEAVKHGAIADEDYFGRIDAAAEPLLTGDAAALAELILRSVRIKAEVVSRDEREGGPRKMLNFGHTIGHAVEAASGYRLLHGQAVAIGMVAEAVAGEQAGITAVGTAERLRGLLRRLELPTEVPAEISPEAVLEATRTDKKSREGRVEYALLERIGRAGWGYRLADAQVLEALQVCGAGAG